MTTTTPHRPDYLDFAVWLKEHGEEPRPLSAEGLSRVAADWESLQAQDRVADLPTPIVTWIPPASPFPPISRWAQLKRDWLQFVVNCICAWYRWRRCRAWERRAKPLSQREQAELDRRWDALEGVVFAVAFMPLMAWAWIRRK